MSYRNSFRIWSATSTVGGEAMTALRIAM
jgi:hypothetical protein